MTDFGKNIFFILLLAVGLISDGSLALGADTNSQKHPSSVDIALDVKAGYRVDQVDWNIAGNRAGTNPNILSELTWDDLEIFQIQLGTELTAGIGQRTGLRYHLRGMIGYGNIVDGSNQDSDYAGDNRTLEFSRTNNVADGGDVLDISVGGGLEFSDRYDRWFLIPMIGYSYHQQELQITDGNQTISDQTIIDEYFGPGEITMPSLGPLVGLDSRYHSEWSGPWLGLHLTYVPVEQWQVAGSIEYHLIDYFGEANWNLREDLNHPVSFRHWADGTGVVYALELNGRLSSLWSCNLTAIYQDWQADDGTDITYLSNGTLSGTRFNEVNWESFSVMAGLTRRF